MSSLICCDLTVKKLQSPGTQLGQGIFGVSFLQVPLGEKTRKNKHLFSSPLQEEGGTFCFSDVDIGGIVIVQLKKELIK